MPFIAVGHRASIASSPSTCDSASLSLQSRHSDTIPKQMPELGLVVNAEAVGRNLLQQHNCAAALASGDIDDAWEAIALAGEEFLLLAAKAEEGVCYFV